MDLGRRMDRLEQQRARQAARRAGCPLCGFDGDYSKAVFDVGFAEGPNEPEPGDKCAGCGRPLVIRIQFDKAG